jgi:hypothetical protein
MRFCWTERKREEKKLRKVGRVMHNCEYVYKKKMDFREMKCKKHPVSFRLRIG